MATERTPSGLYELFARAVARSRDEVAVDVPPGIDRPARQRRSYAELDADASRLAATLGPDGGERVVAILLGRDTPWLYAAQLAALRVGAAYVSLEPRFPDDHLRFVLTDAGAEVVLTDAVGVARLRGSVPATTRLVDVASVRRDTAAQDTGSGDTARADSMSDRGPAPAAVEPSRLAYLIYTSGTTGRPKGVMIEHRSIVNLVRSDLETFRLGPGDRVAQGSSPAYDSSVEETWLALASGATVVPMDDEVVRRGPDLVGWLRDERITVLCPPPTLLRTMACADPERALPELGLVYAGGEALPQDLADRWARGRRFVNGYGPTECTVTVTRAEVRAGEAVTIGDAVVGNRAVVVDEALSEVAAGQWGELCIAGVALARGYLGRPDLTAERFCPHPVYGRVYRTGDRVRRGPGGALEYDGRLDAQVKLRGHRVELAEIDVRLAACAGVRAAVCAVQDGGQLVGFVVPSDPCRPPAIDGLIETLRRAVPAHMVPSRLDLIDALPTTVGGKLDRSALPRIGPERGSAASGGRAPHDDLERVIAGCWADVLGVAEARCEVDFFALGGDSVRAALLVSELRDDPSTAALTVRDVYDARTIDGLASRARAAGVGSEREAVASAGPVRPLVVTAIQSAWLLAELMLAAWIGYALAFVVLPAALDYLAPIALMVLAPIAFFALRVVAFPLGIATAVLAKRALIGRYTARREPVWGAWHLRHWIVQRCVRTVPWAIIQGTELQSVALRALGARIGRDVHLHRGVDLLSGGWDLLEIGDRASIAQDAALGLCELDDRHVVVGPVRIGRGAVLEVRAGVAAGASVGDEACVTALSAVGADGVVPAGSRWDGVPAQLAGLVGPVPTPDVGGPALGRWAHAAVLIGARAIAASVGWSPLFALTIVLLVAWDVDAAALRAWLADPSLTTAGGVATVLGLLVASAPLGLVAQALALRFGPRVPAGVLRTRSVLHVVAMMRARTLEAAGVWLSGTLFWPSWLRAAGARVGARSEVSTIVDVLPEQVTIGPDSFFADGIYLGGPRVDRGTVTVGAVQVGRGSFLGNHVVIAPGTELPDEVLLGVCTVADPERVRPGSSWFGHPPFELPRREIVEVDRRLTFEPGAVRYANRVLWEALRVVIPTVPALALLGWFQVLGSTTVAGAALWFAVVPAVTLAVAVGLALFVLALKWLLLGRVRPGRHALWSCWCSRWDFLYVAWGMLARGSLSRLGGTLWLAWYLRAMGVRIGRRVVLGPGFAQVVDPDMLTLEDGATVDTMFQAHSFEDRVLKIGPVTIRAGATVRRASVVLYGAEIGAGGHVAAHSVVMKNERLLPRRSYAGVPTRPAEP